MRSERPYLLVAFLLALPLAATAGCFAAFFAPFAGFLFFLSFFCELLPLATSHLFLKNSVPAPVGYPVTLTRAV